MRRPSITSWRSLWQHRLQTWLARQGSPPFRTRRARRRTAGGPLAERLESRTLLAATVSVEITAKIAHETNGGPTLADRDNFGQSVAHLGDLDGDGIDDLAVGAYQDDTGGNARGAVYVLLLNADGTVKSQTKIASETGGGPLLADQDQFGISVASLGDRDGDGIEDLAVGAGKDDTGGMDRGAVYVLFLNADGTVKSHTKLASDTNGGPTLMDGDSFGVDATLLGDLDGDGIDDLGVGAFEDDTGGDKRGAFYVLFLNPDATVKGFSKIANDTAGGLKLEDNDQFGRSVAALGDLDGDGVTDLAVGSRNDSTGGEQRGAVHVLFMNADGTVESFTKIANETGGGPTLGDLGNFGVAAEALGDINGDGVADLAVGAHRDNTVYLLLLNADGTVNTSRAIPSETGGDPAALGDDRFGISVALMGDLDGDGLIELAVGARDDDTGGERRGAVYVLSLNVEQDVPIPSIIDDGDTGYSDTGNWSLSSIEGRDGDVRFAPAGNGSRVATYEFSGLTPGANYEVAATWSPHANRATNAPYTILDSDGVSVLETALVNQEVAPNDFNADDSDWDKLAVVTVSGTTLTVQLSNAANQYVIADAIRVIETEEAPPEVVIIDDGEAGYADTGWAVSPVLEGRLNDIRYRQAGNGAETATWTFTGLTPGNYAVAATWSPHANRATDAPFTIFDGIGGDLLEVIRVDQEFAPGDFTANGSSWKDLAVVAISGSE